MLVWGQNEKPREAEAGLAHAHVEARGSGQASSSFTVRRIYLFVCLLVFEAASLTEPGVP